MREENHTPTPTRSCKFFKISYEKLGTSRKECDVSEWQPSHAQVQHRREGGHVAPEGGGAEEQGGWGNHEADDIWKGERKIRTENLKTNFLMRENWQIKTIPKVLIHGWSWNKIGKRVFFEQTRKILTSPSRIWMLSIFHHHFYMVTLIVRTNLIYLAEKQKCMVKMC